MCNYYRNDPAMIEKLQPWLEYIRRSLDDELPEVAADVWPKAMPLILHPENYDDWLPGKDAEELATRSPSQLMSIG